MGERTELVESSPQLVVEDLDGQRSELDAGGEQAVAQALGEHGEILRTTDRVLIGADHEHRRSLELAHGLGQLAQHVELDVVDSFLSGGRELRLARLVGLVAVQLALLSVRT